MAPIKPAKKVGHLWVKRLKNGNTWLIGYIWAKRPDGSRFCRTLKIAHNHGKHHECMPDYNIYDYTGRARVRTAKS